MPSLRVVVNWRPSRKRVKRKKLRRRSQLSRALLCLPVKQRTLLFLSQLRRGYKRIWELLLNLNSLRKRRSRNGSSTPARYEISILLPVLCSGRSWAEVNLRLRGGGEKPIPLPPSILFQTANITSPFLPPLTNHKQPTQ